MDRKEFDEKLIELVKDQNELIKVMTKNQKILLSCLHELVYESSIQNIKQFIDEEIKGSSSYYLDYERNELYEKYFRWCKQENELPAGKKNFYEEARKQNCFTERRCGSNVRFYYLRNGKNINDDSF